MFELELCFMLVKLMYSKTFVIQVYNKKQFSAMAEKKNISKLPDGENKGPLNLSKSFFENRMWPLVHWLAKSSFPVVGF